LPHCRAQGACGSHRQELRQRDLGAIAAGTQPKGGIRYARLFLAANLAQTTHRERGAAEFLRIPYPPRVTRMKQFFMSIGSKACAVRLTLATDFDLVTINSSDKTLGLAIKSTINPREEEFESAGQIHASRLHDRRKNMN
jgi:hypothetical protein